MKTQIIAASLAIALAALPLAAQAAQDCGVPQGYGTSNPSTFNRSTCGFAVQVANKSSGAGWNQVSNGESRVKRPAGYGTSNPYIPNSGAPDLGSNTAGL